MTDPRPQFPRWFNSPTLLVLALLLAGVVGVAGGYALSFRSPRWEPPPMTSSVTIVRPTPNVVVAVRDLARLETTTYHVERVVDLRDKQSRLFGLIESEDAILLVAAARVSAGVDLGKLRNEDVVADPETGVARVVLPAAEVFHAALDNERTFVHSRSTDWLAKREMHLESKARQAAERTVREAALEAGILNRACENAQRTVGSFVRSLGYDDVRVTCAP